MNECIRNFHPRRGEHRDSGRQGPHHPHHGSPPEKLTECQQKTGHLYNLEATPAEGTTYRFARVDAANHPGIIQAGTPDAPYYTNSTQLPVYSTEDPFEALDHQEELQAKYTGGTVFHMYLGERVSTPRACRELVKRVADQLPHPLSHHHAHLLDLPDSRVHRGEHKFCPTATPTALAAKRARSRISLSTP